MFFENCENQKIFIDNKIIKVEPAVIYNDTTIDILFGKMAVWNKIYKKELSKSKKLARYFLFQTTLFILHFISPRQKLVLPFLFCAAAMLPM